MTPPTGSRVRLSAAACFWIGCLQFFVLEALSTIGFVGPYSYRTNYISDLGAVHCGQVCSHWHALMNASFLLQGLCITAGVLLLPRRVAGDIAGLLARGFLLIAAYGVIVVGLTPEDTNNRIHIHGALFNFIGSSSGLLLLGVSFLRFYALPKRLATITLAAGAVSLFGDLFFVFPSPHLNAVVGAGLLERIAAYPLPLCLPCIGFVLLKNRAAFAE
jgi:hypothetical membrane protein